MVAVVVLLSSFLVITGLLYQDFTSIQHNQLEDKLLLAATGTEQSGKEYLEKLTYDGYRLTWISPDGVVMYDNSTDIITMENHSDREEFREALKYGMGDSSRHSSTLTEKTIYEAVLLSDGSILRISVSRDTSIALVLDMLYPMILIAVLAIILSIWLAQRMATQIVEPLNQLNLDRPLENDTYEELAPLLQRLDSQHQEIELQMQLLKHKQQEFDQITDNMKEALVLLDAEHRIISINPAAVRLFHTSLTNDGMQFHSKEYGPEINHAIQQAEKNGHAEFTASVNESKYLFNISCIESDETVLGIVLLAFDVTEQAQAEQLRRDFTANVSHELKTPLQTIIGSAELIENNIVQPQDMPRFVGHIRKEASRLLNLIEDIIRLAQLDSRNPMPVEEVSLLTLSYEVQDTLLYAAKEKNVSINVSGDTGKITGVHSLLYEMIYNLADNAIRYNNLGGSVQISIKDKDNQTCLCVSDTGIGIPLEHQSKIFERFYRVDKSHSRKSGGTGLGLSIVKHAVKYHHGSIQIDSVEGKGTSISCTLASY